MRKIQTPEKNQQLMTLADVARYLKIAPRTAYGWLYEGKLPGFKIGNAWRFDKADIQKWVQECKGKVGRKDA